MLKILDLCVLKAVDFALVVVLDAEGCRSLIVDDVWNMEDWWVEGRRGLYIGIRAGQFSTESLTLSPESLSRSSKRFLTNILTQTI